MFYKKEKEEFDSIINDLNAAIEKKNNSNREIDINAIIEPNKGWGINFVNYCSERRSGFRMRKNFFKMIDVDNVIETIKKSTTKDISDFRKMINTIYDYDNIKETYSDDLENLEHLYERLESLTGEKEYEDYAISKKYNIKLMKESIKKFVEELGDIQNNN